MFCYVVDTLSSRKVLLSNETGNESAGYRRGGDDDDDDDDDPRRQDSVSSIIPVTAEPTSADGTSSGYSRRSRVVVSRQT